MDGWGSRTWLRTASRGLLLIPVIALLLNAQSAARITGTVHDQNGLPLGGVSIDARGQDSAMSRKLNTDASGAFILQELPADTYLISASCSTCSDASSIVEVGAGQVRSISMELNTESASTVVSLETQGTTLDTSSAKLGINVSSSEVESLPVNGRSFSSLSLTAPLIVNTKGAQFGGLHFAGQSTQQNRYTVDDIDDSSVVAVEPGFIPTSRYEFRLRNSLETIDEFRVDSASYTAESGWGAGAQFKLISKAGSNQWHGSLFEYFRDESLQARNFFDSDGKTELHVHRYGANAGGDIVKDKLFLFGSFEKLTQRSGLNIFETVPSIGARANAVESIRPILDAIPLGLTTAAAHQQLQVAERQSIATQDESNLNVRADYIASGKQRLFARYSQSAGALLAPDLSVTRRTLSANAKPDQMVLNWSYQLNANAVYRMTAGVNRASTSISVNTGSAALDGIRIIVGQPLSNYASPGSLILLDNRHFGGYANYHGRTYNLVNAVDWTRGPHSVQFGFEAQVVRVPFTLGGGTSYAFRDDNSFLSNTDADITYVASLPERRVAAENFGGYAQDTWRLGNHAQLIFGVRYEYYSAPRESEDRASIFNYLTFTSAQASGAFYRASKTGFQPRIAFTWSPQGMKGTVLRLGAGMYSGHNAFLDSITPIQNSVPVLRYEAGSYPASTTSLLNSESGLLQRQGIDLHTFGRQQQNYLFSASLQQSLPHRFVAEVSYAGMLSRHLTDQAAANISSSVDPVTGETIRPNEHYYVIPYLTNVGSASYNALRIGLNRRLVDNLTVAASYNFSHSIADAQGAGVADLTQNPLCRVCERSSSDFDVKHTFATTFVYELPFGKGHPHFTKGFWSGVLGGWSTAGAWYVRTGLPVNVTIDRSDEILYSPGTQRYFSPFSHEAPDDVLAVANAPAGLEGFSSMRPNLVFGVDPYSKSGTQWLNPAAFSIPLPGNYGNLGRNALRGPDFNQFDLQVSRSFHLCEKIRATFRAEAFNVLNRVNFSNPTSNLPDTTLDSQPGSALNSNSAYTFGSLNSTVGRTVGLGTARQFQLSLRVEF